MDTTAKIYLTIAIVAVVLIVVAFSFISKKAPKGVLLGLGAFLWFAGLIAASPRIRELQLIGGILQMSGFIGVILGFFDLIRKPKGPKAPPPEEDRDPRVPPRLS